MQLIAEYRRKVDIYNAMIHEWARELGIPASTIDLSVGEPTTGRSHV